MLEGTWGAGQYDKALVSNSTVRLLMPILGETGCRLPPPH
jgi:hypothetical protein